MDGACSTTPNQASPPGPPGCPTPKGARHGTGKAPRDVSFPVPWLRIEAVPLSDWRWVVVSRSSKVALYGPGIASQPVWVVQPEQGGELNIQMRRTAPNRPRALSLSRESLRESCRGPAACLTGHCAGARGHKPASAGGLGELAQASRGETGVLGKDGPGRDHPPGWYPTREDGEESKSCQAVNPQRISRAGAVT